MLRRHIGKQPPHHRLQRSREHLHEPGALCETHHPHPNRHKSDKRQRDFHHRILRLSESTLRHHIQTPRETSHDHGHQKH